ncbi:hypothetical protein L6270_00675 [Candidatus Parcubacteria bacterium]|nr:hypothetical protein [Patescibacteria group bacterium]MBU4309664.1 hypothetical protein [Patescibacteria group bacterium]MBU4432012.1 hypothetical protein [Patescibacteria group bacterium]MBU4577948.1 hypothetical protein [Patescibacteria group bacterium]MCG2696543.1 hypothetical protein [Candidatus Parcubacteria bacterium]
MTKSDKKQLPFQITGPCDISVIKRHLPNFDFKQPVTKAGYDSVKRVVATKIGQQRGFNLIKYIKENNITIGCTVKEMKTGHLEVVSSITKGGRLAFKGVRKGSFSPIHWKLHQPTGDKHDDEKKE